MSVREITYNPGELVHPQVVDGKVLWTSPEVQEMVRKLHYGAPELGWEGDPRLALYHEQGGWVLERLEADGQYRTVCRSKPGAPLDDRLIVGLIAHDHRRGFDPAAALEGARPDVSKEQEDAMREGLERAYYGAAKDLGYA